MSLGPCLLTRGSACDVDAALPAGRSERQQGAGAVREAGAAGRRELLQVQQVRGPRWALWARPGAVGRAGCCGRAGPGQATPGSG